MKHSHDNWKILQFLYWLPRISAVIYICFLALFALDVFVLGKTMSYYIVAFFLHLLPSIILAIALAISWKKEFLGGFLFIAFGLFFTVFFHTYLVLTSFIFISFPVISIGLAFLVHNFLVKKY